MYYQQLIGEALREPSAAIAYHVSQRLAELFPGRAIVEGEDFDFTLPEYAAAGLCTLRREESVHGQVATVWNPDEGVRDAPRNIWYEVEWRGHALDVLLVTTDCGCVPNYWILAESDAVARGFFRAVCEFDPELRDEILVFDGGRWEESAGLFRATRAAGFDSLILGGGLKEAIRADLERFFASRTVYESLGAPWKRGLLLTGPPGNGKTHTIKALIHALGKPCLYVKSFKSERFTEERNIRRIFERARRCAPCLLVLEDLDALVTDENRSFLLNEVDGFAANAGIATVATTNHPERLDPAIVERPSRFDRKYHFGLPGEPERHAFIARWAAGLPEGLRPSPDAVARTAATTEGFSFAYLKELFLSSVMAHAAAPGPVAWDDLLRDQVAALRAQMSAASRPDPDAA